MSHVYRSTRRAVYTEVEDVAVNSVTVLLLNVAGERRARIDEMYATYAGPQRHVLHDRGIPFFG